ncbi:acyl-CoA dehydrogenase family protein [Mycobacterium paraintracellulare]|uniref:acyl-CoA dehydrogenase family protein n=1 Tax=Mycobacterium paraintracellulare TaxID=1138383 RepID=UPI0019283F5B|nr:acyl-CoA dehydrogenase family protein [Mycobacterium paraintracellulare]
MSLTATKEEQLLRETVAELASSFGPSYYQQICREHRPPAELWNALGEQGFLGVHLPAEYGGGGEGLAKLAIVMEELAAAGCPLAYLIISPGIVGTLLARHATAAQAQRWLPGIASGASKLAFALTEPGAGSNSHAITTRARREGDHYLLTGQKYYITGVEQAEAIVVVARTGESASGRGLLSLLIVDADADGVSRQSIPTALEEPEEQSTLFFDDVAVPGDRIIGAENDGLRVAFDGMNPERILFAATAVGISRYALQKACDYARGRQVFGAPIATYQAVAHPLAEGKLMLDQAALMTRAAAALFDAGAPAGELANTAKYAAAEAAAHCLDAAMQTHGGNGMALEYQLSNYWFMVRMLRIGPVSKEMILNYVAEHSLGLPRSYGAVKP